MSEQRKITLLGEKAGKAMQDYYRSIGGVCYGESKKCTGRLEVMHHHFHWGHSMALRFEERNLVPLCNSCHCAHHNYNHKTKVAYETEMRNIWGNDWEDQLLKLEQKHIPKTALEKKDFYKDLINNVYKI